MRLRLSEFGKRRVTGMPRVCQRTDSQAAIESLGRPEDLERPASGVRFFPRRGLRWEWYSRGMLLRAKIVACTFLLAASLFAQQKDMPGSQPNGKAATSVLAVE